MEWEAERVKRYLSLTKRANKFTYFGSLQMAIEIMNYTYEYCIGNQNITQGELQDVLEDLMDQEFDTICEDGSIPEICRHLLRYKQMSLEGKYAEIELELAKIPQGKDWLRPDVKITYTPIEGDSSSEDGSDSEDDDDMDVDGMTDEPSTSSRVTRSQASRKTKDEFVEPEDGWTTVRTRRK